MNRISKVFERTVLNPDFEAEHLTSVDDHLFSFETVFYRTPYSYCCCPCAYHHEFFDYLSDKDDISVNQKEKHIDKPLFECIVQNVAEGRCPHTNDVDPKYLATSIVSTNHILAAAGSTVSVNTVFRTARERTSIFDLHPYLCLMLTHLSLASLLWDIGKQNSPRCDAAECGVPSGAILFA